MVRWQMKGCWSIPRVALLGVLVAAAGCGGQPHRATTPRTASFETWLDPRDGLLPEPPPATALRPWLDARIARLAAAGAVEAPGSLDGRGAMLFPGGSDLQRVVVVLTEDERVALSIAWPARQDPDASAGTGALIRSGRETTGQQALRRHRLQLRGPVAWLQTPHWRGVLQRTDRPGLYVGPEGEERDLVFVRVLGAGGELPAALDLPDDAELLSPAGVEQALAGPSVSDDDRANVARRAHLGDDAGWLDHLAELPPDELARLDRLMTLVPEAGPRWRAARGERVSLPPPTVAELARIGGRDSVIVPPGLRDRSAVDDYARFAGCTLSSPGPTDRVAVTCPEGDFEDLTFYFTAGGTRVVGVVATPRWEPARPPLERLAARGITLHGVDAFIDSDGPWDGAVHRTDLPGVLVHLPSLGQPLWLLRAPAAEGGFETVETQGLELVSVAELHRQFEERRQEGEADRAWAMLERVHVHDDPSQWRGYPANPHRARLDGWASELRAWIVRRDRLADAYFDEMDRRKAAEERARQAAAEAEASAAEARRRARIDGSPGGSTGGAATGGPTADGAGGGSARTLDAVVAEVKQHFADRGNFRLIDERRSEVSQYRGELLDYPASSPPGPLGFVVVSKMIAARSYVDVAYVEGPRGGPHRELSSKRYDGTRVEMRTPPPEETSVYYIEILRLSPEVSRLPRWYRFTVHNADTLAHDTVVLIYEQK